MDTLRWGPDCQRRLSLLLSPFWPRTLTGKPRRIGEPDDTLSTRLLYGGTRMRFLTALVLSISFAAAGANAAETAVKQKSSRAKSILRAMGSLGGGLVLVDPYQEVRPSSKKAAKPAAPSAPESAPVSETLLPPTEKSETPQPPK